MPSYHTIALVGNDGLDLVKKLFSTSKMVSNDTKFIEGLPGQNFTFCFYNPRLDYDVKVIYLPRLDEVPRNKDDLDTYSLIFYDVDLVIYHWNGSLTDGAYLKTLERAVDILGHDIWKHAFFSLGNHNADQQLRQVLEKEGIQPDIFNEIPAVFDNEYELPWTCLTCCKKRCIKPLTNILRIDPRGI